MMRKFLTQRRVFLGGTCAGTTWRDHIIPLLKIPFFNPVVENWTPESQERERVEKDICSIHLYVITPEQIGWFNFIEMTVSAMMKDNITMVFFLSTPDNPFPEHRVKSISAISAELIKNGVLVADIAEASNVESIAYAVNSHSL